MGRVWKCPRNRNFFEKIVMNQANRLVKMENPQKEDLITLKKEDVVV